MAGPAPGLSSPAQLLSMLQQSSREEGAEPPVQDLLESVQRAQGGAPPPLPADQLEVFPEPCFVVKTANEQGQKVFINVVGSPKLPLPGGWRSGGVPPEVKRHLEEAQGGEAPAAMRFPLSLGPPRIDADHRGEPCLVADCMFSSEVLARCGEYRPLKLFLIQLALGTMAQKCGLELSPQYKLPKMRYKGGTAPPPQRIRLEGAPPAGASGSSAGGGGGAPLIAEVGPDGEEPPAFALLASKRQQRQRAAAAARPAAPAPQGQQGADAAAAPGAAQATSPTQQEQQGQQPELQAQIEYDGKPATAVRITLPLPAAAAAAAQQDPASISTEVCAEAVRVQVPGCAPLQLRLPFAVSTAGGSAQLVPGDASGGSAARGACSLVLRLPYRPFSSVLGELRQAAGAAEGQAGGGSMMDLD